MSPLSGSAGHRISFESEHDSALVRRGGTDPARCRVCHSGGLRRILDLGSVPLANAFVAPSHRHEHEPTFELGLQFCPACTIVQIPELVDPEVLFRDYLYTPSASSTWRDHCEELSGWLEARVAGLPGLVIEPASNDGCLLKAIQRWCPNVLGVEPARNIAAKAVSEGVPTWNEFFNTSTARDILSRYGKARLVVGTNVLAHVPDIVEFAQAAATLLDQDGSFVIEAPYLRDLVEAVAYDTIYHEHVSYLSVTALSRILPRAGLVLTHVERTPVHGGSLRLVARLVPSAPDDSVGEFLAAEKALGYEDGSALVGFAARVNDLRMTIAATIRQEVAAGRRVAAYGATAKGNTLLTTCGISDDLVRYIVDRNPLKQGRLAPGSHIPVVGPEQLNSDPVDVLLILAWNIADEIIDQLAWFARGGGRFLVPIPSPRFA